MTPTDRALYPLVLDLIAVADPLTGLDEWCAALQRLRKAARSVQEAHYSSVLPGPMLDPSDVDAADYLRTLTLMALFEQPSEPPPAVLRVLKQGDAK